MFAFIKKVFIIGLLASVIHASNNTKHVLLNNQKWMIQPTLINLYSNEHTQGLRYYLFVVKLDKCIRSFNTLGDLSNEICAPNKTENLNLKIFNIIVGLNESETLTKHISWECKCK